MISFFFFFFFSSCAATTWKCRRWWERESEIETGGIRNKKERKKFSSSQHKKERKKFHKKDEKERRWRERKKRKEIRKNVFAMDGKLQHLVIQIITLKCSLKELSGGKIFLVFMFSFPWWRRGGWMSFLFSRSNYHFLSKL